MVIIFNSFDRTTLFDLYIFKKLLFKVMNIVRHEYILSQEPYHQVIHYKLAGITHSCYYVSTMLTTRQKTKIIKETGIHDKDTGSPEIQVALLSKKIAELTDHLKKHKKDNHSRRGLLGMVADRQTHLVYLKKKYPKRYATIIKKLDLKK